jgi:hypothetical protein
MDNFFYFFSFSRCIGWKIQNNPTNKRTCKHLRDHLGDTFEQARIGNLPVEKRKPVEPSQRFSHITIPLSTIF